MPLSEWRRSHCY